MEKLGISGEPVERKGVRSSFIRAQGSDLPEQIEAATILTFSKCIHSFPTTNLENLNQTVKNSQFEWLNSDSNTYIYNVYNVRFL